MYLKCANFVLLFVVVAPLTIAGAPRTTTQTATAPTVALYDPNPTHPWNRLNAALFARVANDAKIFGIDEMDPLYWPKSTHLLTDPAYTQAITMLDEFIAQHAHELIKDPAKRAAFQSDLWAIFDWSTGARWDPDPKDFRDERAQLQSRLARIISRLRLSKDQIASLPDTYAAVAASTKYPREFDPQHEDVAFLPANLFDIKGPWVELGIGSAVATPAHTSFTSGRSLFRVFMRVSGSRKDTLDYLDKLRSFDKPFVFNPKFGAGPRGEPDPVKLNPDLPQFPVGTSVALVRQMIVIDDHDEPALTPITQSVQLRVYRDVAIQNQRLMPRQLGKTQAFFEFDSSRQRLFFDPSTALKPVASSDKEFILFQSHDADVFDDKRVDYHREQTPVLERCIGCHYQPGIQGVNTFTRAFTQHDNRPTNLEDFDREYVWGETRAFKKSQYNWGLLEALLRDAH